MRKISKNEYKFSAAELEARIPEFASLGITEIFVNDAALSRDRSRIKSMLSCVADSFPELFVSVLVRASCIDMDLCAAASELCCSLEIPLDTSSVNGKLLFDKKLYSRKASMLNSIGNVFGFQLEYSRMPGDTLKLFFDRLDFAVGLYPNHIDFPQLDSGLNGTDADVTGVFSAGDVRYARDVAFACRTFYSAGRAVPWMNSILKPLRIHPSRFFADFAEWQRCGSCDFKSGFEPEAEPHVSLEKMQILFIDEKYEEKGCGALLPLVHDIVRLNGAMSRCSGEGEESVLELSYNPDDLLGPESAELALFHDNVCMENCRIRVFASAEGPDYEILADM